mmetsp:Transcript_106026/g.216219  ORF Transcript_106026/g.216219 Transcript_106026/m.216219 type:complete len:250 (+) Transcript_106026:171-920(+)|eukprot:CAMPEP_0201180876 /NCGR_PEP_ID=MMETSP0851-20130426/117637_1 /ASSEMBLY_ACC=CAM_ASM_000631 /TAXON_ID=183588 /ORGANISM="Pseudo-nitzschia fraudulenta, Strain WWA7" /LENGTH=249 /DNA_ID=CAMNT_0047465171 /DNA_START=162 /DNA_END=911 /DNA_ORIENTATION=+
MKFLSCTLLVLGIFCVDVANSYVSSSSPTGGTGWTKNSGFAQPPTNIDLDDIFREEYHAWAKRYGKSAVDGDRFETFKVNFMLQMQHNKKTGTFNHLNEFGDMTAKEFELGKREDKSDDIRTSEVGTSDPTQSSPDNVVEAELVESLPRVRMLDSQSIPRVMAFDRTSTSPNYGGSQQPQIPRRVSLGATPAISRYPSPYTAARPRAYASQAADEPRVYRQDQLIGEPPKTQRKRRLVRMHQVGPDKIL